MNSSATSSSSPVLTPGTARDAISASVSATMRPASAIDSTSRADLMVITCPGLSLLVLRSGLRFRFREHQRVYLACDNNPPVGQFVPDTPRDASGTLPACHQ